MLFNGLLHGLLSLLSKATQDHLPRGGSAHNGLGPPTPIITLKTCQQVGHTEAFSQLRVPVPR